MKLILGIPKTSYFVFIERECRMIALRSSQRAFFVRQIYASLTRKLLSNLFKVTLGQKLRKWSDYAKSKINDMIFTETTRQCKQYTTPPLWELKFLYDYKIQNVRKRLKVSMLNGAMGIFFYHYFSIRLTNSQSVL